MKRKLVVFGLLMLSLNLVKAQADMSKAQAVFIYNFTKFFEWPITERAGDFVIGVLGSSFVANNLTSTTKGKTITAQNIVVKKFRNFEDVTKCHVIFVGSSMTSHIPNITKKTGHYTLIVSDSQEGISKGSVINFLLIGEKLKFEFSKPNADKTGLKYHSRIIEMAHKSY